MKYSYTEPSRTHLEGDVAAAVLVVRLEEVLEARKAHAALLRDLVLVVQTVVGEGGEGRAGDDAHGLEGRVEHLEDAHVAEVDVTLYLLQVVVVSCDRGRRG